MIGPFLPTLLSLVLAAGIVVSSPPAFADALQQAQQLMKQGRFEEALQQTERILRNQPRDAQARFAKGLILTEMNRPDEAIAVFASLTEDYPELPEPYNNLAVLYDQKKQYEKAKTALEMAIRTHPAYATAHENLGDIYARMASRAYDKALQLDSSNVTAQNKLALIKELIAFAPERRAVASAAKALATEPASRAPEPPVRPPVRVREATGQAQASSQPQVVASVGEDSAQPSDALPRTPAPVDAQGRSAAEKAIDDWAAAWSRKDADAYLAHYAVDFQTPNGQSRSSWEAERRMRIGKPKSIRVSLENLEVTVKGADQAIARFRQHYRSPGFNSAVNKILVLVRREDRWLIQQERIASR